MANAPEPGTLDTTTTRDSFQMKKTSGQMPALGHHFGPKNTCECGKEWSDQKVRPTVCPKLMERLQTLEDMDKVLQLQAARIRKLELALAEALATKSVENTLEHILRCLLRKEEQEREKAKERKARGSK